MVDHTTSKTLAYLRASFAWDYTNSSGQNLLAKTIRQRRFVSLDTLATGLSARPHLHATQARHLAASLQKNARSSTLLYGLFPLLAKAAGGGPGKHLCTPLFLTELGEAHLTDAGAAAPRPLLVNQVALAKLIGDEAADPLAARLQALLDRSPVGHVELTEIVTSLTDAVPGLKTHGFDIFPLLQNEQRLRELIDKTEQPQLVCAGAVYIARRSRQSMGIIHELGAMCQQREFSRPVRQLVKGHTAQVPVRGPLNVIGALSTPQRKAIMAARRHSLSVVHGPPGTGKTHVLTMLVADQLASGQSVLICARTTAATDVIERFLSERLHIGEAIVRGGGITQLRELKARVMQILKSGQVAFSKLRPDVAVLCNPDKSPEAWPLARSLRIVTRRLRHIDRKLARIAGEISDHVEAGTARPGPYYRLRSWLRKLIGPPLPPMHVADLVTGWRALHQERESVVLAKLQLQIQQGVVRTLVRQRTTLSRFAASVTAREHNQRRLQNANDYSVLTRAMPLWISTLADLSQILPLQRELFDLVIIDEASQADIASAMPALQRARRVVIIGDTHQLRHISFLPAEREASYRSANGLLGDAVPSYRNDSVLDWVNRQIPTSAASSFLDEHFRSSPEIIEFSNREFYGGQLKLLTHTHRPRGAQALQLFEIANARCGGHDYNKKEAEAVIAYVQQLMTKDSNGPIARSIGIVSPFRAQADYLKRLAARQLDVAQSSRHRLMIGTAHDFQGEERDVVLFSCCIDDDSPGGSLNFLSRADVLNVAVTRARQNQTVFLSRSRELIDSSTRFGRYVAWASRSESERIDVPESDNDMDGAIAMLLAEIDTHECEVSTQIAVGSVVIDILLRRDAKLLGVDLIGFGDGNVRDGLHRHELELLYRQSLPIIPVTHADWNASRELVIGRLNQHIAQFVRVGK